MLSFCYNTGPQTIYVIQNASLLGSSSTGIALNHNLNPSNIGFLDEHISFSENNSIHDLSGQKISFLSILNDRKSFFSFENLSSSLIPIYGNTPSDDFPLGYFDVYWYALEFARSINLNQYFKIKSNIVLGYKIKANLYKLFTDKASSYYLDLGLNKKINDKLNFGMVINNIGNKKENISNDQISGAYNNDIVLGIGFNYKILNDLASIASDIYYRNNEMIRKISINTNFPYLNFVLGNTAYGNYHDFSYGFSLDIKGWNFVYGYLSLENPEIGNPKSIQIIRNFK